MSHARSCQQTPANALNFHVAARLGFVGIAAAALLLAGPVAHAVTISFNGFSEVEIYDDEGDGELIGGVSLQISGAFDYNPAGAENPHNPEEYVAVASNPWITIGLESFFTFGSNSPEQDQIVTDFASSFPLESNFSFVLNLPGNPFDGARNDIGEAFASFMLLSFSFPSNPGNNTLALLENLYLELVPVASFSPGTLAGATQNLLSAADPNNLLSSAVLTYDGPLSSGYFLSAEFSDISITVVPVPAAVWLFASGLAVLGFVRRRGLIPRQ